MKSAFKILFIFPLLVGYYQVVPGQGALPKPALWLSLKHDTESMAILYRQVEPLNQWPQAAYQRFNFHAVPSLDGGMDDYAPSAFYADGGITVFSVYQANTASLEEDIWTIYKESRPLVRATDFRFLNFMDSTDYFFKGIDNQWLRLSTHFFNHEMLDGAHCEFEISTLNKSHLRPFHGALLEELVYGEVLSKKQRKQVESYLAVKYGIPILSPGKTEYLNSQGDVIWSMTNAHPFRYRPTALGRDNYWGLHQLQSTNAYEPNLITIGLGDIESLNERNKTQLNDLVFLFWADNNGQLEIDGASGLLGRRWEVTPVGNLDSTTSLRLGVRQIKETFTSNEKLWLAIDTSGTGTFSIRSTAYYAPRAETSNREFLSYENIPWDRDLSGKDHFTFFKGGEMILVADTQMPSCDQEKKGSISFKVAGGKAPYTYNINGVAHSAQLWFGDVVTLNNLATGVYPIRITDSRGRQMIQQVRLNYADINLLYGLKNHYVLEGNQSLFLSVPGSCADCVYNWTKPDGNLVSGPNLMVERPGNYQFSIEKNGCKDSYPFAVSGSDPSPFQSVEIWGNPAQNGDYVLEIRLWEIQPVEVTIFTQQGQLVRQFIPPLNHYHKISGSALPAGSYNIQVSSNGQIVTKQLITF